MLGESLRERYLRDGYLLLEGVLSARQLADLRRVTDEFVAGASKLAKSNDVLDLHDAHSPDQPRVRRIKNPHMQHPLFHGLVRDSAVLKPLQSLLGPDIRLHGSKLNLKSAGGGDAIEWHQDWAFYPHTNDDVLAIGLFLDDVTIENAPILFVPGSHLGPIHDHHARGVFAGGVDVKVQKVDVSGAVAVTGPAGSMSIHHARLLHGSAVNRSSRQRRILFYELAAADAWPLMGKGHFGGGDSAAFHDWFDGMMVCGQPTWRWRMEANPVRVPYPEAYSNATSSEGTIYKAQQFLSHRYFDDIEGGPPSPSRAAASA